MSITSFRTELDAIRFAHREKPYTHSLTAAPAANLEYARRYGARAAVEADACRASALRGDLRSLEIHQRALSIVLAEDRPNLFDASMRKPGQKYGRKAAA